MLGHYTTMAHGSRLALNFHDAVDEHQRLVGKTHARGVAIHGRPFGTEDFGNGADGELQTSVSIQARRRRWRDGQRAVADPLEQAVLKDEIFCDRVPEGLRSRASRCRELRRCEAPSREGLRRRRRAAYPLSMARRHSQACVVAGRSAGLRGQVL